MTTQHSDVLVLFGATGDLAYKQIFPSLQALIKKHGFNIPIIGVAKSGWNLDQLKDRARSSLENNANIDRDAFAKLCSLLHYVDGDYKAESTYQQLRQELGKSKRPLHYLAIPPEMFEVVAEGLARS